MNVKRREKMENNNQSHWNLRALAREQTPATEVDLWPGLEKQLKMKQNNFHPKRITGKQKYAFALAIVLLLFGSLACVPNVRAFAEDIIQQMGIAFMDTGQRDRVVQMEEAAPTTSNDLPSSLSEAEIQGQISFQLLLPAWVPNGLDSIQREIQQHYDPKTGVGSGAQVEVTYGHTGDPQFANGILRFEANDGPIGAPPLLAEGRQQSVTVNGQSGYYVHGAWQNDGTGDANTRYGDLTWDDQADAAYLTWSQDGVTYLLEANGLGLGLSGLNRIAESLAKP
jgi:hypothetical protein